MFKHTQEFHPWNDLNIILQNNRPFGVEGEKIINLSMTLTLKSVSIVILIVLLLYRLDTIIQKDRL